jgi:hypothetical protein
MTSNRLVPSSKDDLDAINALANASEQDIIAVADELLEWLQDGNWPVSYPVGVILSRYVNKLSDKLVSVFRSYDSIWKYWCIKFIIMELNINQIPSDIIHELRRMVESPTASDIEEGAAEAATEVLSGH